MERDLGLSTQPSYSQHFDQLCTLNFRISCAGSFFLTSTSEEDHNPVKHKSDLLSKTKPGRKLMSFWNLKHLGWISSVLNLTTDTVSMRSSFRLQSPGEISQQVPATPGNSCLRIAGLYRVPQLCHTLKRDCLMGMCQASSVCGMR